MMSNEGYQDRILTCRDCGQDFTFSAGEQEFYASRGLTNLPCRCPACRAARRSGQSSYSPRFRSNPSSTEHYETTCATCGRPTSVPFIPREDRPVYCTECFQAQRAARSSRRDNYSSSSYGNSGGYGASGNSYGNGGGYGDSRGGRDRRDRRDNREYRW